MAGALSVHGVNPQAAKGPVDYESGMPIRSRRGRQRLLGLFRGERGGNATGAGDAESADNVISDISAG